MGKLLIVERDGQPPLLSQFLATEDAPCPCCGYNLRGLTTDRCPECDQRLRLSLVLEEPHTGRLIAAIAGLLTCAGSGGLILLLVLSVVLVYGKSWPRGVELEFLIGVPALALATTGVPAIALARRNGRLWFSRRTPLGRTIVVAACWSAPPLFLLYYLLRI